MLACSLNGGDKLCTRALMVSVAAVVIGMQLIMLYKHISLPRTDCKLCSHRKHWQLEVDSLMITVNLAGYMRVKPQHMTDCPALCL